MLNQTSFRLRSVLLPTDTIGETTQVINKVNEEGKRYYPTFSKETLVLTNDDRTVMETTKASCVNGQLTFHKRGLSDDQSESVIEKRKLQWNPWTLCFVTAGSGDIIDKDDDIVWTGKQTYAWEMVCEGTATFKQRLKTEWGIDYPSVATFADLARIPNPSAGMLVTTDDEWELYKFNKLTNTWWVVTTSTPVPTPDATSDTAGKVKKAQYKDFTKNYELTDIEVNQKVVTMEMMALGYGVKYDAIISADGKYGYSTVAQALKDKAVRIGILGNINETERRDILRAVDFIEKIGGGIANISFPESVCTAGSVIFGLGKYNRLESSEWIWGGREEKFDATVLRRLRFVFKGAGSFPTEEHNGCPYFRESANLNRTILFEDCAIQCPNTSNQICLSSGVHMIFKNTNINKSGSGIVSTFFKEINSTWLFFWKKSFAQIGDGAKMNAVVKDWAQLQGKLILDMEGQSHVSDRRNCEGLYLRGTGSRNITTLNESTWPQILQMDTGITITWSGLADFTRLGNMQITIEDLRSCRVSQQTVIFNNIASKEWKELYFGVLNQTDTGKYVFKLPNNNSSRVIFKACKFSGKSKSQEYFNFQNSCPLNFVECEFIGNTTINTGQKCALLCPHSPINAWTRPTITFVWGGTAGKVFWSMNINFSGSYSEF